MKNLFLQNVVKYSKYGLTKCLLLRVFWLILYIRTSLLDQLCFHMQQLLDNDFSYASWRSSPYSSNSSQLFIWREYCGFSVATSISGSELHWACMAYASKTSDTSKSFFSDSRTVDFIFSERESTAIQITSFWEQ